MTLDKPRKYRQRRRGYSNARSTSEKLLAISAMSMTLSELALHLRARDHAAHAPRCTVRGGLHHQQVIAADRLSVATTLPTVAPSIGS